MIERREGVAGGRPGDHHLLFLARVIDLDEEHEAIELRLGERIRPLLLDGVLRGEHEERLLEARRLADHRHLLLLHRLEHRRLRLRRRPVDLIGEDDVGEHRAGDEAELAPPAGRLLKDVGAGDVHRHQIGGELDPAELQRHRLGEPADEECLGEAGNTDKEGVAAGEEADREPFDRVGLADDHPAKLVLEAPVGRAEPVELRHIVVAQTGFGAGSRR